jgi:hypothetical protein
MRSGGAVRFFGGLLPGPRMGNTALRVLPPLDWGCRDWLTSRAGARHTGYRATSSTATTVCDTMAAPRS